MKVKTDKRSKICNLVVILKETLKSEGARVDKRKKQSGCNVTVSGTIHIF